MFYFLGEGSSNRRRRSTCKKVDYAEVHRRPRIDGIEDPDGNEECTPKASHGRRKGNKTTARKMTPAPPPSASPRKGRGRPRKNSKQVVVPPTKLKSIDPAFKMPAEKSSREATCQVCRKVFPTHYLAEHMNVAHNAVQLAGASGSGTPSVIAEVALDEEC